MYRFRKLISTERHFAKPLDSIIPFPSGGSAASAPITPDGKNVILVQAKTHKSSSWSIYKPSSGSKAQNVESTPFQLGSNTNSNYFGLIFYIENLTINVNSISDTFNSCYLFTRWVWKVTSTSNGSYGDTFTMPALSPSKTRVQFNPFYLVQVGNPSISEDASNCALGLRVRYGYRSSSRSYVPDSNMSGTLTFNLTTYALARLTGS